MVSGTKGNMNMRAMTSISRLIILVSALSCAAIGAAAQAAEEERSLDSVMLATAGGDYPLQLSMDGASYRWRLRFPKGSDYEGYRVAIREGTGAWRILDEQGRIMQNPATESLFAALWSNADTSGAEGQIKPLMEMMSDDSAFTFPGWRAKSV